MIRSRAEPLLLFAVFASVSARADTLPYPVRTRAYSGYQPTVRGDNETVGMAGSTVAIPTSVSELETNPAGLTMTMGSVTAQLNSNEVDDREVAGPGQKVRSAQWGLTVTPNDWGYSLSYYSPSFESGNFTSLNNGLTKDYEVSTKQVRLAVAHSLLDKQLSVGGSVEVVHGIRKIGETDDGTNGLSFQLGAIYHWKKHIVFGASYSPPFELGSSLPNSGGPDLPGFSQPIRSPWILNVGTGWLPNRFFMLGASVAGVGTTEDTALLKDQSVTVGDHFTLQPRLGVSYILGQYRNLKIGVSAGTYYEVSRNEGEPNRLHGTFSFQVNPYFINLGFGVDRASHYDNVFFSLGFDIVRTVRLIGIIPQDPVPPYRGFFPPATEISADGMPDGLTRGEKKDYEAPSADDVKEIIMNIPTNIQNRLQGLPMVEPSPKPSVRPKRVPVKPKKKKKKKAKNPG